MDNTTRPDNDISSLSPVSEVPSNNSPVPTNNDAMDLDEHNHQDPPPAQTPPDHVQSLDSTQDSTFPLTSTSFNIKRDITTLCVSRQLPIQEFLRKIQTRERFIIFDAQKEVMRDRAEWILDALSKLQPKPEVIQMTREPSATQRLGNIREVIREGLINAGLADPLNEERIKLEFGQIGSQGDESMDTDLDIDLDDDPETPKTPRQEYWSG
ncbi:hypothetical protein B0O99DRAFT_608212 [Bisporella sp. PMI_857]|nr:hypothetical protein B0O99DRAFT_608212 [Bisporella sp. PMI_857]